jgi:hypothetical protein
MHAAVPTKTLAAMRRRHLPRGRLDAAGALRRHRTNRCADAACLLVARHRRELVLSGRLRLPSRLHHLSAPGTRLGHRKGRNVRLRLPVIAVVIGVLLSSEAARVSDFLGMGLMLTATGSRSLQYNLPSRRQSGHAPDRVIAAPSPTVGSVSRGSSDPCDRECAEGRAIRAGRRARRCARIAAPPFRRWRRKRKASCRRSP